MLNNLSGSSAVLSRSIVYLAIIISILASTALLLNAYQYHFIGNNYFPPHAFQIALSILLMYMGFIILLGKNAYSSLCIKEIFYLYCIMSLIALATNAAQYTPFVPVDSFLIIIDKSFHFPFIALLDATHNNPMLHNFLSLAYDSLTYQMLCIPLFLIVFKKYQHMRRYYFLLLITTLLGFSIYYFFPTTGPASILDNPCFSSMQKATGLKFTQIHHYQTVSTIEGGLIAFPSFHVIWAMLCLYLLKPWPFFWALLFPFNICLICACVLLGWHYAVDVLFSFFILYIAQIMLRYAIKQQPSKPLFKHFSPNEYTWR